MQLRESRPFLLAVAKELTLTRPDLKGLAASDQGEEYDE